jgi:hypothetical protein
MLLVILGWSSFSVCVKTRSWATQWNQVPANLAPKGRPNLAQRFSAGKSGRIHLSPGGTTEFSHSSSLQ